MIGNRVTCITRIICTKKIHSDKVFEGKNVKKHEILLKSIFQNNKKNSLTIPIYTVDMINCLSGQKGVGYLKFVRKTVRNEEFVLG